MELGNHSNLINQFMKDYKNFFLNNIDIGKKLKILIKLLFIYLGLKQIYNKVKLLFW